MNIKKNKQLGAVWNCGKNTAVNSIIDVNELNKWTNSILQQGIWTETFFILAVVV